MQNGTTPACASPLESSGLPPPASQTRASESFDFVDSDASLQPPPAIQGGRQLTATVASSKPSPRDASASEDEDSGDDSDGSVPFFPDPSAADGIIVTRGSKKRGGNDSGPDGKWRARARATDYTSSASIEKNCPPWRGSTRYGQEPFPLKLLINPETAEFYPSKYRLYHIVSDWRRQSPKYQADWWREDAKYEKAFLAEEKKMETEAKKAAAKAKTAAKRNKNKREKRKAAKDAAAAAAAAIAEEDAEYSGEMEEVSCVFVL